MNHLRRIDFTPLITHSSIQNIYLDSNPFQKPVDLSPLGECEYLDMITMHWGEGPRFTREYTKKQWREDMNKMPTIRLPRPGKLRPTVRIRLNKKYPVEYNKEEWIVDRQGNQYTNYRPK